MPSIHLHHVHLLLIAHRSAQRAFEDSRRPDALTDDSLLAVVMAATAAEAFINELAEYLFMHAEAAADWSPLSPQLLACAEAIVAEEKHKGSLLQKYVRASEALGTKFDENQSPLREFKQLVQVRHAIVHLKPSDKRGPKHTDSLADQGIAQSADKYQMHWVDRLQTPEVAGWAVNAARGVILSILEMAPLRPGVAPEFDPLHGLRTTLRDHPGFNDL